MASIRCTMFDVVNDFTTKVYFFTLLTSFLRRRALSLNPILPNTTWEECCQHLPYFDKCLPVLELRTDILNWTILDNGKPNKTHQWSAYTWICSISVSSPYPTLLVKRSTRWMIIGFQISLNIGLGLTDDYTGAIWSLLSPINNFPTRIFGTQNFNLAWIKNSIFGHD